MSEERNPIGTRSIVFPEQHASTVDEYRSEDAINQAPICVEGHCITCSDEALQVRVLSLDCDTGVALVELGEKTELRASGSIDNTWHAVAATYDGHVARLYLDGAEVDYVETLEAACFKFDNPQGKSTCGCGSSFNV